MNVYIDSCDDCSAFWFYAEPSCTWRAQTSVDVPDAQVLHWQDVQAAYDKMQKELKAYDDAWWAERLKERAP